MGARRRGVVFAADVEQVNPKTPPSVTHTETPLYHRLLTRKHGKGEVLSRAWGPFETDSIANIELRRNTGDPCSVVPGAQYCAVFIRGLFD